MTNSLADSLPGHSPDEFSRDFLAGLGNKNPSPTTVAFVSSWQAGESGGGGGLYNPLNSVLGAPGASNLNSVGVKNYTSYQQGVQASVATFSQTQWAGVRNALVNNDVGGAIVAIETEYAKWGGHVSFPNAPASGVVSAPAPPDAPGQSTSLTPYAVGLLQKEGIGVGKNCNGDAIAANADDATILRIVMPGAVPNLCVTRAQGRALLGGVSIIGGSLILLVGLGVLAIGSKPGRALSSVV